MGRREREQDLAIDLGQLLRRLNTLGERADRLHRTAVAEHVFDASLAVANAILNLDHTAAEILKRASTSERFDGRDEVPF